MLNMKIYIVHLSTQFFYYHEDTEEDNSGQRAEDLSEKLSEELRLEDRENCEKSSSDQIDVGDDGQVTETTDKEDSRTESTAGSIQ